MPVDVKASSIRFVYPFLFSPGDFAGAAERACAATWPDKPDEKIWTSRRVPIDDLLPHVARYLNLTSQGPGGGGATAHLLELCEPRRKALGGLGASAEWLMVISPGTSERTIPIHLGEVELALFSIGVGLLTLCVSVESDRIEDWLDVLHFGRFTRGSRTNRCLLRLRRRTGIDPSTRAGTYQPYFPNADGLLEKEEGGRKALDSGEGTPGHLLQLLLRTAGLGAGAMRPAEEVFVRDRMLAYTTLFVDTAAGTTEMPKGELLFRARRMLHSRQPYHAAADDDVPAPPRALPYAKDQWFLLSLEGSAFVALDAPRTEFFRVNLPRHLGDEYFLLFLLALHQRFVLMGLSEQVAQTWPATRDERQASQGHAVFENIREALFSFTARGYFAQVVQRENHHRFYLAWQELFQIERLYQEVNTEVREMHDYLRDAQEKRLEHQVTLLTLILTVVIGAPSLVLSFLNMNLAGITIPDIRLGTAFLLVLGLSPLLGGFFLGVWWLVRRLRS